MPLEHSIFPQYDLSSREERRALPFRTRPYFTRIRVGRSIGVAVGKDGRNYWVARVWTTREVFCQRRVGITDDYLCADGIQVLDYPQALAAAEAWFLENRDSTSCKPLGPRTGLIYSPVGEVYTIGHALQAYIKWKWLTCSPSHVAVVVSRINHHLAAQYGTIALSEVTAALYRQIVDAILATPPGRASDIHPPKDDIRHLGRDVLRKRRSTANTLIGYLRNAIQMAWEDARTESERAWRVFRPIRNTVGPRTLHLSRGEVRVLLSACAPPIKSLVLGALYTGCRIGELILMCAADVGRDGYGVYVGPGKGKARFVFLPDEGMAFFLDLARDKAKADHLFLDRHGRPWRPRDYIKDFKQAIIDAGLPKEFCFHSLRHTYASQLVQAGAPFIAVSEQLGHANPIAVMVTYGHLSPQIREAEVRQRFTTVSRKYSVIAKRDAGKLTRWRKSLHGNDWRTYAKISDLSSRQNTVH